ncbi:MAG: cation-translocating P-type ATPase, partial [Candidatus Heimdallarchaeaceae archaeon]
TFIESGRANAIVVNTGVFTELGRLSTELQEIGTNEIPIRAKVNKLAKWLGIAVTIFLVVSIIYKVVLHHLGGTLGEFVFIQDLVITVTTSMAIMPISIPLLTTLILLTGVISMAKDRVIIRNLSAVETLGRCSVLCTDKTGTITTNSMTIQKLWDTKQFYGVSGIGFSNKGAIFPMGSEPDEDELEQFLPDSMKPFAKGSELEFLLIGGLLNNNAHLIVEEVFEPHYQTSWKTTGDPTDGAFLALFNKSGMKEEEVRKKFGYISEFGFDSTLKRMSRIFQDEKGYTLFCKGATETVLPLCTHVGGPNEQRLLTSEEIEKITSLVNKFAAKGYRVISLAYKLLDKTTTLSYDRENLEKDLVYNGFVCMQDPPRFGVKSAVEECFQAEIIPIMITGDSSLTAKAIGKEVGLIKGEELVVEGNDIKKLSEEEFFNTRIFARVSPQHKQVIVEKYQNKNKIIAMCGDGVNDCLALTNADVGICMGIEGTDVAKQASDVIISDDSFTSTVLGIREGRGLFEKIRVMIFFYIALNVAEAIIYFSSSFIPGFLLVNDFQRVYIFSTAHLIPPFAFIVDSIAKEIMDFPPRDDEEIFNERYIWALVILAITLTLSAGLIYIVVYLGYLPPYNSGKITLIDSTVQQAKARTMFVTVLVITESLVVLSLRRLNKSVVSSLREDWKWIVMLLVAFVPIFHVLLIYIPQLQNLATNIFSFNVEFLPLGFLDWLVVIVAVSLPLLSIELYKYLVRKKHLYF